MVATRRVACSIPPLSGDWRRPDPPPDCTENEEADAEIRRRENVRNPGKKRVFSRWSVSICIAVPSGEGGIRTLGDVAATPVFETGPIGRSGTSPNAFSSLPFLILRYNILYVQDRFQVGHARTLTARTCQSADAWRKTSANSTSANPGRPTYVMSGGLYSPSEGSDSYSIGSLRHDWS